MYTIALFVFPVYNALGGFADMKYRQIGTRALISIFGALVNNAYTADGWFWLGGWFKPKQVNDAQAGE
jgi:hypothetical protein